ncbi:MAG: patatin-like phospholipase family protein [Christensenellales bacterium]|jgi:NTE family protein
MIENECKVGLALGAGGFRGLSHIGVIEVLQNEGIRIDAVSGCSMGSIIAACFACGMTTQMMERLCSSMDNKSFQDMTVPRRGLIRGDKMEAIMRTMTANKKFSDIAFPLSIIAVNLTRGHLVTFKTGDNFSIARAIHASCAIPGVFCPVPYGQDVLVDGGIIKRLPMEECRDLGVDFVIGVDVAYRGGEQKADNIFDVIQSSIDILQWENRKLQMTDDEFVITPNVRRFHSMMLRQQEECIEEGRIAAKNALPAIRDKIAQIERQKAAMKEKAG